MLSRFAIHLCMAVAKSVVARSHSDSLSPGRGATPNSAVGQHQLGEAGQPKKIDLELGAGIVNGGVFHGAVQSKVGVVDQMCYNCAVKRTNVFASAETL
jgi:hypothetical protein